jgi:hypothetical protein
VDRFEVFSFFCFSSTLLFVNCGTKADTARYTQGDFLNRKTEYITVETKVVKNDQTVFHGHLCLTEKKILFLPTHKKNKKGTPAHIGTFAFAPTH